MGFYMLDENVHCLTMEMKSEIIPMKDCIC